jgi:hypothetical protein
MTMIPVQGRRQSALPITRRHDAGHACPNVREQFRRQTPIPCATRRANHAWCRSSPLRKNIPLFDSPNSRLELRHPVPHAGHIRIVRNAGRDAVDAAASAWTGVAERALPVSDHPHADERRQCPVEPFLARRSPFGPRRLAKLNCCVRQNRVGLASVADVKLAEATSGQPVRSASIRQRR